MFFYKANSPKLIDLVKQLIKTWSEGVWFLHALSVYSWGKKFESCENLLKLLFYKNDIFDAQVHHSKCRIYVSNLQGW